MVAHNDVLKTEAIKSMDPIWDSLRHEARVAADRDPMLAAFFHSTVLSHASLEDCVIYRICERLDHSDVPAIVLRQAFEAMMRDWPEWSTILRVDIQAVYDRDQQNNENYFIFCGELIFGFTKTPAGCLFTEIGMND